AFAAHLLAKPGLTGREHDEIGIEAHLLEDLPGLEKTIVLAFLELLGDREDDGGVQGEAIVEDGVSGEVDDMGVAGEGLGASFRRSGPEESLGASWKKAHDPLYFLAREGERRKVETMLGGRA